LDRSRIKAESKDGKCQVPRHVGEDRTSMMRFEQLSQHSMSSHCNPYSIMKYYIFIWLIAFLSLVICDFQTVDNYTSVNVCTPTANGVMILNGSVQSNACWFPVQQTILWGFEAEMEIQINYTLGELGDGVAFVIQDDGPYVVGSFGDYMGYVSKFLSNEFFHP